MSKTKAAPQNPVFSGAPQLPTQSDMESFLKVVSLDRKSAVLECGQISDSWADTIQFLGCPRVRKYAMQCAEARGFAVGQDFPTPVYAVDKDGKLVYPGQQPHAYRVEVKFGAASPR